MTETETYRGIVSNADCDHLGHMNVARYFAAVGDGMFVFQAGFGLGVEDMRNGRRLSFAVVHAESDFRAEILVGEVIVLKSLVLEIGSRSATFGHRLIKAETGVLAFESRFKCVLLSLATRKSAAVPDELRTAMRPFMADRS